MLQSGRGFDVKRCFLEKLVSRESLRVDPTLDDWPGMLQEQQHEIGRDLAALVQPSEQGVAQPHPEGETPEDEEEYDPEQGGMEF